MADFLQANEARTIIGNCSMFPLAVAQPSKIECGSYATLRTPFEIMSNVLKGIVAEFHDQTVEPMPRPARTGSHTRLSNCRIAAAIVGASLPNNECRPHPEEHREAMCLEGWQHGTDSQPSFETRVSATQERRRDALLRMRVYPGPISPGRKKSMPQLERLFFSRSPRDKAVQCVCFFIQSDGQGEGVGIRTSRNGKCGRKFEICDQPSCCSTSSCADAAS
jgi:hypothetical protein